VLVKALAASIIPADWHYLTADHFPMRLIGNGLFKPKNTILGTEIAGCVEAVGRNVKALSTQLKAGSPGLIVSMIVWSG
jgi:NADPH:quinone reductase-like Zn-dependent oxidoreductase